MSPGTSDYSGSLEISLLTYLDICHGLDCCIVTSSCVGTEEAVETPQTEMKSSLIQPIDHGTSDLELTPESRLPTLSSSIRYRLLKGDMDQLPAIQSRVVRIYISSNYYGTSAVFSRSYC